jgi:hypothetical protein
MSPPTHQTLNDRIKSSPGSVNLLECTSQESLCVSEERLPRIIPSGKHRFSKNDGYIIFVQLVCLALATMAIFWSKAAIFLGQVNQLIVIGFLLAIMGLCLDYQAKLVALILAGNRKKSTIQDFDALMRKDISASNVHWEYRLLLLFLFGLPLGLSVPTKISLEVKPQLRQIMAKESLDLHPLQEISGLVMV